MTAEAEIKEHPMGEAGRDALRVCFDRTVKLEFHGATVSSDAGLLPYRDLDDAVRLTESAAADLLDLRTGRNIRHRMAALLRQSVYSRLAGYEDVNVNGEQRGMSVRRDSTFGVRSGFWGSPLPAGAVVLVADSIRTRADPAFASRERRYSGGDRPGGVAGRRSNGKCRINIFDVLDFLNAWQAGCP